MLDELAAGVKEETDSDARLDRLDDVSQILADERDLILASQAIGRPDERVVDPADVRKDVLNAIEQLHARDGAADLEKLRHMMGDRGYDERHVARAVADLETSGEIYRPGGEGGEVKPV